MPKKQKKFPGESDSNVFARVASREVRKAREDNRGELGQLVTLDAKDAQLVSDALQILNPDSRTKTKRARKLEDIFWNLRAAKTVTLTQTKTAKPKSPFNVTAQERDTILAALRLWQCDSAHIADVDGSLADIAAEHGDALTDKDVDGLCERINAGDPKSSPVFIEVSGGVVSSVKNCRQSYTVIDWDNLLGDAADTRKEWKQLSKAAQRFIESEYPEDFDKIQDRIAGLQGD